MVQRNDKRMIACGEDFLLGERSFDLIALNHLLLAQD
jgi:hypothetical protein